MNTLIADITLREWEKDWEGPFAFLDVSIASYVYFGPLKKYFGINIPVLLLSYQNGIASAWLPRIEYEIFGATLAQKASDPSYVKEWVMNFQRIADTITAAIQITPEEFFKKLDDLRPLYNEYGSYQVATKAVFNFLPPDMVARQQFEAARTYSESFYKESAGMFARLGALVASREPRYTSEMITMLSIDEFSLYRKNGALPAPEVLNARHERSGVYWDQTGPLFLSAEDIDTIEATWAKSVARGILKGVIAYKGRVTGKVRVIRDYKHVTFAEGEILVTGMTDPNYVPLMKKAAAIVTDGGGLLCHAAIMSRELKVPCIIGTKFATQVFKNGDIVEVDADNGVVRNVS